MVAKENSTLALESSRTIMEASVEQMVGDVPPPVASEVVGVILGRHNAALLLATRSDRVDRLVPLFPSVLVLHGLSQIR